MRFLALRFVRLFRSATVYSAWLHERRLLAERHAEDFVYHECVPAMPAKARLSRALPNHLVLAWPCNPPMFGVGVRRPRVFTLALAPWLIPAMLPIPRQVHCKTISIDLAPERRLRLRERCECERDLSQGNPISNKALRVLLDSDITRIIFKCVAIPNALRFRICRGCGSVAIAIPRLRVGIRCHCEPAAVANPLRLRVRCDRESVATAGPLRLRILCDCEANCSNSFP